MSADLPDHPDCKDGCRYAYEVGGNPARVCPEGECQCAAPASPAKEIIPCVACRWPKSCTHAARCHIVACHNEAVEKHPAKEATREGETPVTDEAHKALVLLGLKYGFSESLLHEFAKDCRELERRATDAERENELLRKHILANDSDSIVGACNCNVKTPEIKHHKKGCKYRLIEERNAAESERDALRERLAAAHGAGVMHAERIASFVWGYFQGGSAGSADAVAWFQNHKDSGGPKFLIEQITKILSKEALAPASETTAAD